MSMSRPARVSDVGAGWPVGLLTLVTLSCLPVFPIPIRAQAPGEAPAPSEMQSPRPLDRREALRQRRAGKGNLLGHGGPIKAIASDPERRRVLTGSFDYSMMLWDISEEEPKRLARFDDHGGAVNAVAFVPGTSQALAGCDDGKVVLWDLDTGALLHRFEGHEGKIAGLAVSLDGRWAVSAGWDRTARLWNLGTRQAGPVLAGHAGPVNAAVFSADGTRIFTASADGTVSAWSRAEGQLDRPILQHGWGVNVLARLPDGTIAFGALNGAAGILDAATGALVRDLPSHERPVLALTVTEKPGLLAVGGGDGRVRVYRLPDGVEIEEHRNLLGPVWAMAFTGDGTALYYGGLDDFATLWRIAPRAAFEPVADAGPRRFQQRVAADDILSQGELQFARKCSICHTLEKDGANRAGPTLHGVFGRRIGTLAGYPYSDALRDMDIVWGEESIDKLFALGPDAYTPGSKMPLQRMTDAAQRNALIAYLKAATTDATAQPSVDGSRRTTPDSKPNPEPSR